MRLDPSLLFALSVFTLPACGADDPCVDGSAGGELPCHAGAAEEAARTSPEGAETATPEGPSEDPCPPCGRG